MRLKSGMQLTVCKIICVERKKLIRNPQSYNRRKFAIGISGQKWFMAKFTFKTQSIHFDCAAGVICGKVLLVTSASCNTIVCSSPPSHLVSPPTKANRTTQKSSAFIKCKASNPWTTFHVSISKCLIHSRSYFVCDWKRQPVMRKSIWTLGEIRSCRIYLEITWYAAGSYSPVLKSQLS